MRSRPFRQRSHLLLLSLLLLLAARLPVGAADINPYQAGEKALHIGSYQIAVARFTQAIEQNLQPYDSHLGRGSAYFGMREWALARADFEAAARLQPKKQKPWTYWALVHAKTRDYRAAALGFQRAIQAQPEDADARNAYAWLLATCPEAAVRDGRRALAEAQRASELSRRQDPRVLDTLAAAHAEMGNFEEAIRCQDEVLKLEDGPGRRQSSHYSTYRAHRKLFQRQQPVRDTQ